MADPPTPPSPTHTHLHHTHGSQQRRSEGCSEWGRGAKAGRITPLPPVTHGCSSCHLPGAAAPQDTCSGRRGPHSRTGTHIHGPRHCKDPGLKGETSQDDSGWTPQLRSLAPLHKWRRPLLTLTAPPIRQQVIALSAAALWPTKRANTVMLAAVVPKAAVVNGWWEGRDKDIHRF